MDKRIKTKWLKALRSRQFKQTTGQLREDFDRAPDPDYPDDPDMEISVQGPKSRFCCLGVLCEVLKEDYDGSDGLPDQVILDRAGLTASQADVLANLNDSKKDEPLTIDLNFGVEDEDRGEDVRKFKGGFTFGKIATFIEKYI